MRYIDWTLEQISAHMKAVFVIGAFIVVGVFVLAVKGTMDEAKANARCIGLVTEKYNEYDPGVTINTGSNGVGIPTGSTEFFFAIKMSDGTFCSRKVSKATWLSVQRGETYGG